MAIKDGHPLSIGRERGWLEEDQDREFDGQRFDELTYDERCIIEKWFKDNFEPASKYNRDMNSYVLKHRFEDLIGRYVSNDQAKDAMLSWGFKPKDPNVLNWVFKFKPKQRVHSWLRHEYYRNGASMVRAAMAVRKDDFWRNEDLSAYNDKTYEDIC